MLIARLIFLRKFLIGNLKPFGNGYLLFNNHQGIMAGIRKAESVATGNTTVFHVTVDNLEQTLEKTKAAGGHIKVGKTTIPAMGWYACSFLIQMATASVYTKKVKVTSYSK
ncbi:MAG: hypothetical protein MZV64_29435 [Ignavibacteriales bacterium]|nr:hypothetical protein [Ignavibacteriales bacterium]